MEAKNQLQNLLLGVKRYQSTAYVRQMPEPPVIWRMHNARLLDYTIYCERFSSAPPVIFIPSLINRYYVLDLSEQESFVRYLSAQGIRCFILDWGQPGVHEQQFDCADYVKSILLPALYFMHETNGEKPVLAGYCMGGVLALAASLLAYNQVEALALLATPWDFRTKYPEQLQVKEQFVARIEQHLQEYDTIPADWVQTLFMLQQPWSFSKKFQRFAKLQDTQKAEAFMRLEHWVNDGVDLSGKVAKECLVNWGIRNELCAGKWAIDGTPIVPQHFNKPAFFAIPQSDQIVPKASASALASHMKQADIVKPSCGHVGMIVGSKAKAELWEPFAQWVQTL